MLFPILLRMKAEVSFTQLLFGLKIIMLNYLQNSDKNFSLTPSSKCILSFIFSYCQSFSTKAVFSGYLCLFINLIQSNTGIETDIEKDLSFL